MRIDWQAIEAVATSVAAAATTAAVIVALWIPQRMAARDLQVRSSAAIKLAELASQALGSNPSLMPGVSDEADRIEWRAKVTALANRMDRLPSDYVPDAEALSAFIWITDLLRQGLAIDVEFGTNPTYENAAALLQQGRAFPGVAEQRLVLLRARLIETPRRR